MLPKTTHVYQGWGRGVQIGELELRFSDRGAWAVAGLDCAAEHALTVNGEPREAISVEGAPEYLFIAPEPSGCYVYSVAVYRQSGGRVSETPLWGQSVYVLPDRVNEFLKPVPQTPRVDEITATVGAVMRYLTEVPCED